MHEESRMNVIARSLSERSGDRRRSNLGRDCFADRISLRSIRSTRNDIHSKLLPAFPNMVNKPLLAADFESALGGVPFEMLHVDGIAIGDDNVESGMLRKVAHRERAG